MHLTEHFVQRLFGPGHRLRARQGLRQPGQFAAEKTVTLVGPRGMLEQVRVVGPTRHEDQVELSRTDEIALGLRAPLRLSGSLDNTPGIRIAGPRGEVALPRGVIRALRHLHAPPEEARRLGLRDGQCVEVQIDSKGRDLVFGDVAVRVCADAVLELHLDTDEASG